MGKFKVESDAEKAERLKGLEGRKVVGNHALRKAVRQLNEGKRPHQGTKEILRRKAKEVHG